MTAGRIIQLSEAIDIAKELNQKQLQIVLVGGCFDILHDGHLRFLERASKTGDVLMLLLESDEAIQKRKGLDRPVHLQQRRAEHLAGNGLVDYIILLPSDLANKDYDNLVCSIKPAIIATTKGDPYRHHKERQAALIDAHVMDVIDRIPGLSTTNLINRI